MTFIFRLKIVEETYNWGIFESALRLLHVMNQLVLALGNFNDQFMTTVVEHKILILGEASTESSIELALRVPLEPQQERQIKAWLLTIEDRTSTEIYKFHLIVTAPFNMLSNAVALASVLLTSAKTLAYDSVISFVKAKLSVIPTMEVFPLLASSERFKEWRVTKGSNPRIQDFTSPLPYITRIGELLITLPQQVEVLHFL